MGLSIMDYQVRDIWAYNVFPSPLGEMGLSIGVEKKNSKIGMRTVSVPSRGNGVIDSIDNTSST